MRTRIMYIERKEDVTGGPARIGRVTFSKSGSSLYYQGRHLLSMQGGYKWNYLDEESGDHYWISGPKKRGGDRLYSGLIEIDDEVREEYWTQIRGLPDRKEERVIHCNGKYSR